MFRTRKNETYEKDEWIEFFDNMISYEASILRVFIELQDLLKTSSEFDEAVSFIDAWAETGSGQLVDYLSWLATFDISDEVNPENKGLQIMTVHAAKGLEFPSLIVSGLNEGILPSKPAVVAGNIEDETRLFYVAITRARDTLMLAVRPEAKEYNGKVIVSPESRFIKWIGL